VPPTLSRVELADQIEKMRSGGIEMSRRLRDLVAELIERARFHGESPFY